MKKKQRRAVERLRAVDPRAGAGGVDRGFH